MPSFFSVLAKLADGPADAAGAGTRGVGVTGKARSVAPGVFEPPHKAPLMMSGATNPDDVEPGWTVRLVEEGPKHQRYAPLQESDRPPDPAAPQPLTATPAAKPLPVAPPAPDPTAAKPLQKAGAFAARLFKLADLLPGGRADDRPDSDFDAAQIRAGIKHESEHTKRKAVAREIAKDHLAEDPRYYAHLKRVEKDAALLLPPLPAPTPPIKLPSSLAAMMAAAAMDGARTKEEAIAAALAGRPQ